MWSEDIGKKIAHILDLMAERPNPRPHPSYAEITLFDGGEKNEVTGMTSYKFDDGTEAIYGTALVFELTITFPAGEKVKIEIPNLTCLQCGWMIDFGKRYCSHCGHHRD